MARKRGPGTDGNIPPFWNARRYKAERRKVGKKDTTFLLDFADMVGSGMSLAFSDFRRERREESLAELEMALVTLSAIVAELGVRGVAPAENHE